MSASAWAFLTPIVVTVLGGVGWLIRYGLTHTRSTPDGQLTLAQAWQLTSGGLAADVARLHAQVNQQRVEIDDGAGKVRTLEEDRATKDRQIRGLQDEAARVRSDFTAVVSEVRPIVEWIDAGAVPPPPAVSPDLRRLIVDAPDQKGHP